MIAHCENQICDYDKIEYGFHLALPARNIASQITVAIQSSILRIMVYFLLQIWADILSLKLPIP